MLTALGSTQPSCAHVLKPSTNVSYQKPYLRRKRHEPSIRIPIQVFAGGAHTGDRDPQARRSLWAKAGGGGVDPLRSVWNGIWLTWAQRRRQDQLDQDFARLARPNIGPRLGSRLRCHPSRPTGP